MAHPIRFSESLSVVVARSVSAPYLNNIGFCEFGSAVLYAFWTQIHHHLVINLFAARSEFKIANTVVGPDCIDVVNRHAVWNRPNKSCCHKSMHRNEFAGFSVVPSHVNAPIAIERSPDDVVPVATGSPTSNSAKIAHFVMAAITGDRLPRFRRKIGISHAGASPSGADRVARRRALWIQRPASFYFSRSIANPCRATLTPGPVRRWPLQPAGVVFSVGLLLDPLR